MKYITIIIGKDQEIRWTPEAKQSFESIKRAIAEAHVLASPDLSKYFLTFSFSSEHTVVGVILQKNHEGHEQPISFCSKTLRDAPMKYNILYKHAYVPVQALKYFWVYILDAHIIAHVPTNAMKDILTQPYPEGRRGKWITFMLEYDLEIKPTKLIKGQGLAKLMAQSNCDTLSLHWIAELSAEGKNP